LLLEISHCIERIGDYACNIAEVADRIGTLSDLGCWEELKEAAADPDFRLSRADVEAWEKEHGAVPAGANTVAGSSLAGIGGLADGGSYTVYVALIESGNVVVDATASPAARAEATFTVGVLPTEYIRVVSNQGGVGTTVEVPIDLYALTVPATVPDANAVSALDINLTYDPTILTPAETVGVLQVSLGDPGVTPAFWSLVANVVTPGELAISIAGDPTSVDPVDYMTGDGAVLYVDFDVELTAAAGTVTPIGIASVQLNEGNPTATGVGGLFTVLDLVYGDVSGNGSIAAYDAAWVLAYVANFLVGPPILFPIQETAPLWAPLPLTAEQALEVADVDDSGAVNPNAQALPADIAAMDAVDILKKRVGLISLFVAEGGVPASPAALPNALTYQLRGASTSERPGAQITVALDTSDITGLHSGELVLDFDATLLRLVDVSLKSSARGSQPLIAQREGEGQVAVTFASPRPIKASDTLIEVTFETLRHVSEPSRGEIRASHLRLNGSRVNARFAYPFAVRPFQNSLMANYPNPFNPETWIPF
ncbi:MAG: cohesin domain-containing protein, partial [Candidatus Poribacteria bacterium]